MKSCMLVWCITCDVFLSQNAHKNRNFQSKYSPQNPLFIRFHPIGNFHSSMWWNIIACCCLSKISSLKIILIAIITQIDYKSLKKFNHLPRLRRPTVGNCDTYNLELLLIQQQTTMEEFCLFGCVRQLIVGIRTWSFRHVWHCHE